MTFVSHLKQWQEKALKLTLFEEIARIIDGVNNNERLSICFDTCHTHDAGYNVKEDFDGVLNEFDKIIGVDRIKVVHVNDSKMNVVHIRIVMKILDLDTLALMH